MPLSTLADLPTGYAEAAALIDGLDRCLMIGFSRLGPDQQAALAALVQAFAGTPLGEPLAAAVEATGRGQFQESHFAVIAAARAALQGAQYDALRKQACDALGRTFEPAADGTSSPQAEGSFAVWGESSRHWLTELALAGFKQLDASALLPFTATLENMEAEPLAARQAALLGGFQHELLHSVPVSALPEVPLHRWADLWTRGMVNSYRAPDTGAGDKVSGTLTLLGLETRAHASFAAYIVYGLLEADTMNHFVRVNLITYKVDALRGNEVWKSFPAEQQKLAKSIEDGTTMKVKDCTLLPTGDLLHDGKLEAGATADPFAKAEASLAPGTANPASGTPTRDIDRHPVHLAEPVYLEGYTVADNVLSLDGVELPIPAVASPSWGEIDPPLLAGSRKMIGLLRFDAGRWQLHPLAVMSGTKKLTSTLTGEGAWAAITTVKKKKSDTLAILKERASRLLRKKS